MIYITPFSKEPDFSRIVTSMDVCRLSFIEAINGEYVEYNSPTSCKDYMGDLLYFSLLGKPETFLSVSNKQTGIKETIIKLRVPSGYYKNVIKHFHILTTLEKRCNIPPSTLKRVNGNKDELVIFGDSFWIQSPLTLSIYLQIFRSLAYNLSKSVRSVDNFFKLLSESVGNRDGRIAKNIVEAKVKIPYLLNNIGYILDSDKITGISDKYLYDKSPNKNEVLSIHNDKHVIESTGMSPSPHAYSGIEALANRVRTFNTASNWKGNIGGTNGAKWAFNYWKLTKGYDKLDE